MSLGDFSYAVEYYYNETILQQAVVGMMASNAYYHLDLGVS